MNFIKTLLVGTTLFSVISGSAQDLSNHKWKDRLILLINDDENNPTFKSQVVEFSQDFAGIKERKLIIYQIFPGEYKTGLNGDNKIKSARLYNEHKKTDSGFEVVLLGLDGEVKLRQNELLPLEKLYATIDVMPMRRRDVERKSNNRFFSPANLFKLKLLDSIELVVKSHLFVQ